MSPHVVHSRGEGPTGTVITLECNPLKEELWCDHLEFVSMQSRDSDMPSTKPERDLEFARLGRQCDIFLDYVVFLSKTVLTSRNLMNPRFRDLLSPEDEALRLLVKEFRHKLKASAEARRSPAMAIVRDFLKALGTRRLHWKPNKLMPNKP